MAGLSSGGDVWRGFVGTERKTEATKESQRTHTADGRNPAPPGMYKTL